MIKINLVPDYRKDIKNRILIIQSSVAVCALLPALIIIGVFWFLMSSEITEANSEIARLKSEIKKQEQTIKKINTFKKNKKTLQTKMEVINDLQKGKTGPVHLLDDLATQIPGGLWLTSIKQTGMNLEIKGVSLGNFSISNYMINLEKSPYFKNVDLKEIKAEKKLVKKGTQLKNFIITCVVVYSEKKEEEKKEKKKNKTKKRTT